MDREAQIEAIEKTFEDVKMPMEEHYSKKGVYPVEVIPILPDSEMWKFPCAQVFFNTFCLVYKNLRLICAETFANCNKLVFGKGSIQDIIKRLFEKKY